MKKLIDKNTFMEIFSNLEYRSKLDKIILDFFGLDTSSEINAYEIGNKDITLEIILMINTEIVLRIIIKDIYNLFNSSKKFYINLSYRDVERFHELIIPCYWEIYIPYCFKNIKENPKICVVASLFYCNEIDEVREILEKLEIFNNNEIEDILKIIL